jgi:Ser/Thr protein kinase RdoA (MazF antagonist)
MHSEIGFEAFGRLDLHDDRIIVRDWMGSWREYFEQLTRSHLSRLDETPFADLAGRAQERIEPALDIVPEDGIPRLVHGGFRPASLLFDAEASEPLTAVLDWQDVLAALPEYNLAQTEFLFIDSSFQDPERQASLREAFHDGYREFRPMDFEEGYERRRPLYQLSTLLWRMSGFEAAFADDSGLAKARAEAQYRQQFERLLDEIPS